MTDPSIGSSSPNWATLVSNDFSRNYSKPAATATPPPTPAAPALAPHFTHVFCTPSPTGLPPGMTQDSSLSPYASVSYPMGSYASHLLSLEQADQINPQSLPPQPPEFMDGVSVDEFFQRNADMEPAWSIRRTPSQCNLQQHQQGQRQPTEQQELPPIEACLSQAAVAPMAPMPCVADEDLPDSALVPAWSAFELEQHQQQQQHHQQQQQQLHHQQQQELAESIAAQAHVQVQTQPSLPHQSTIREDWRGYEQLIAAVAPQPHSQMNLAEEQQQQQQQEQQQEQQQQQLVAHSPPTPTLSSPTLAPAPQEPCSIPSQPVPHSISVVYDYWREIEEMISAFIAEASVEEADDQSPLWTHMDLPHTSPIPDVDPMSDEYSELFPDLEANNTQRREYSKPAEPKPEQKQQAEQQQLVQSPSPPPMLPTTHREREWWLDAEQKVATAVVAPQPQVTPLADPVCDWWVAIENKTADVLLAKEKEKGQLQQQKQHEEQQQKHPPSSPDTEQNQQPMATSPAPREWWQAAAFTPQQQSVQPVQPVQTVQPLQQTQGSHRNEPAAEWKPYSYAAMSPVPTSNEEKHHEPNRGESSPEECSRSPTIDSGATTLSPATSAPSAPSASLEFPSFEDFARQVTECSLSSSEYIATLRNLMIRAHNLMLPLLRGRFADMTQVQMAAYTTAILDITPLHPSLFLPSHLSPPWISSEGLLPPCHPHSLTPQDLARIQPRPLFANASTQTEYHCWCMHMTMFPPPVLNGPSASRTQGNPSMHFSSPTNGPRMMAPCGTSFWGRPLVPIHAYPQAHQLSRPHGSRYGYRINTYMPYRNPFASSGNNRPRHPGPIYSSAMHVTTKEHTKPLVTGGSLNDSSNMQLSLLAEQQQHPVDSTSVLQLANVCSLQSVASVGHTYSISLQSSSRSSSVGGSDSEDFEDNREDAVVVQKEDWDNCCQKSQLAKSVEDLDQNEGTGSTAQQQTSTKRMVIQQVNSIFLQPSATMISNIMPMMQFIRPSGGQPDIPCPIYNISESYNPNYGNTLSGCMAANALPVSSTDPKNMADHKDSDALAFYKRDEEVLVPVEDNEDRRSEACGGTDETDRCLRSEIQSNSSQTSTVTTLGVAHKSVTDCNDEAAMSVKCGDIYQDLKLDEELVNQSISSATHNADTTTN